MNMIKKIDVPVGSREYKGNTIMLEKIKFYKKNKKKFKNIKDAVKETNLSDRSIRRLNLIFTYGSRLTIDNVLAGTITPAHAEKHIKNILEQIKKREEYKKENGVKLVKDEDTGNKVSEQYFQCKHEFWNQIRLAKLNNYNHVSRKTIADNLDNMMALIGE